MGGGKKKKKKKKSTPQKSSDKKKKVVFVQSNPGASRGLVNLGNTCFFNAVIQNLYRTPELGQALIDVRNEARSIKSSDVEESSDIAPTTASYKDKVATPSKRRRLEPGALFLSLCALLEEMKGNKVSGYGAIRPQRLLTQLRKRAPRFRGRDQQDSQEALRYLLDGVREEEKIRLKTLIRMQERAEEEEEEEEENKKKKEKREIETIVDQFFGGFECSVVECTVCHTKSRTRTRFLDISLPIVPPPKHLRTLKHSRSVLESDEEEEEEEKSACILASRQYRKIVRDPPVTKTWIQNQNKRALVIWIHEAAPTIFMEERHLIGRDRLIAKKFKKQELLDFAYELLKVPLGVEEEEEEEDIEDLTGKLKDMEISPHSSAPSPPSTTTTTTTTNTSRTTDIVNKRSNNDDVTYIEPDIPRFLVSETTPSIRSCLAAYTSDEILRVSTGDGFACSSCSRRLSEWSNQARKAREEGRLMPPHPFNRCFRHDDEDDGGGWSVVKSKHEVKAEKLELENLLEQTGTEGRDEEDKTVTIKRDAHRRILLDASALPPVLVLHLKRFSHSKRGRMTKKSTYVRFQERFSVKEFTIRRQEDEDYNDYVYELFGVVVHMGRLNSGHYVAYVRGNDDTSKWFYISDSRVEAVSKERVMKSEAYLLFYSKKKRLINTSNLK